MLTKKTLYFALPILIVVIIASVLILSKCSAKKNNSSGNAIVSSLLSEQNSSAESKLTSESAANLNSTKSSASNSVSKPNGGASSAITGKQSTKSTTTASGTKSLADNSASRAAGGETKSETEKSNANSKAPTINSISSTYSTYSAPSNESKNSQSSNTAPTVSEKKITANGSELSYWLYTPRNATANMPLIIYLHGGSGKGDDLSILMQNDGFPKYLKDGAYGDIPAYVVIPQLKSNIKGWSDIKNSIYSLVKYCITNYGVNANQVSLTGHSMGGTGAWSLAVAFPKLFSCVAPLSGSITLNDANISALSKLPVWAFVGSADSIVKPDSSIQFISKLKSVNSAAKITVFDGADHFSVPTLTYMDKDLNVINWLISQKK